MRSLRSCGISRGFPRLSPTQGQVAHVLRTRPPLGSREQAPSSSFDLHVLSTPPAFVLSQDQTLQKKWFNQPPKKEEGQVQSLTEKQLTKKNQIVHQSKETHPPPKRQKKRGSNKLALNIVHAVEFSRNGRTRPTNPKPSQHHRGNFPTIPRTPADPTYSAMPRWVVVPDRGREAVESVGGVESSS